MQALVNQAEKVLAEDSASSTLQELHGLILALSKKIQTLAASEEIDRLVAQNSKEGVATKKMTSTEERVEELKEIYRQFLLLENEVSKQRALISANVLMGSENQDDGQSRGLTTRLSLASRLSQDQGELKARMEGFIAAVKQLESRMKLEKQQTSNSFLNGDDAKSFSNWSDSAHSQHSALSQLKSAFEANPATFDDQKKQMNALVGGLENLNDKLAKGYDDLKSDKLSSFSDSKSSIASVSKQSLQGKSPSSHKSINYFSRSGYKEVEKADECSFGSPTDLRNVQNPSQSSPPPAKQRLSIVEQLKSQLQSKEENNLLGGQVKVEERLRYSTPTKAENPPENEINVPIVMTPPRAESGVFDSISERAFNEAEKLTMDKIWDRIKAGTDNLANTLQGKRARDLLISEHASEFTSIASGSFGGDKRERVHNGQKNELPEDMSAKFDFKKQQGSKAASVKKGLSIDLSDNEKEQETKKVPQSTKHATSHRIDHMNYTSTEVRRRPSETGGLISDGRKQLPDSNAVELQLDKDMQSVSDDDGKEMSVFSSETPKYFYEVRDMKVYSAAKPNIQESTQLLAEQKEGILEKMANHDKYLLESQRSDTEFSRATSEQHQIRIDHQTTPIVTEEKPSMERMVKSSGTKPFEISTSDKDLLADFKDFRRQEYNPPGTLRLKNPVASNYYARHQQIIEDMPGTLKQIIQTNTNLFVDEEFRPLPFSIIEDIRKAAYKTERRLEWRRAMHLGQKRVPEVWSDSISVPVKLESYLPAARRLAKLFEKLLNQGQLHNMYLGGSVTDGKHAFCLHNQAGQKCRVVVDDFLPAALESESTKMAYVGVVNLEGHLFLLPALLEKALAKVFGAYSLLHQAPLAAVCHSLFGHESVIEICEINMNSSLGDIASARGGKGKKSILLACKQDEIEVKTLSSDWSPSEIDRWLLTVKNMYDMKFFICLEGSTLGTKLASEQLTESASSISIKLERNKSLAMNLRVSIPRSDGSRDGLLHLELVSQQTLETKKTWTLTAEELGWKDLSDLPAGEYLLLSRFESFDITVDLYGEADVHVEGISTVEYEKIRRGQIRRQLISKPQSSSVLTPIEIDSKSSDSDVVFRIGNFDRISGKLLKVEGIENMNEWMAEVNGKHVTSVAEKMYVMLTGVEEEFLRLFAKKRELKTAGIKLIFK